MPRPLHSKRRKSSPSRTANPRGPTKPLAPSRTRLIAESPFNLRIELVEKVGAADVPAIIEVSEHLAEEYGSEARLTPSTVQRYFQYPVTLPFVTRVDGTIIGYIVGIPLEEFSFDPSFQRDDQMGKGNTLYTYAFVVGKEHKGGGYAKQLKRVFLSWAKRKGFLHVSGHTREGVAARFTGEVKILARFDNWHGTGKPFEYYRRTL